MAGGGDGGGGSGKKRDLGRAEWSRQPLDKRERNEQQQEAKRRKLEAGEELQTPIYATHFSQEEIAAEDRRPKKKVAVLMGYSGTGYHGMQLSDKEKTIEGELFPAFVAAGAISKANAADPKKSSLVRCARTDKGVHAAGNIVSLKLIIEDPDIVQKINEKLSPQIRIWGIQPTNKSFSCYQMCDSRIYEYLIPTHCFLPPHPSTYLGKKLTEIAEKTGDLEGLRTRQEEVSGFWDEVDEKHIKPILVSLPEDIRKLVGKSLYLEEQENASPDADVPAPESKGPEAQPTETKAEEQATENKPADEGKDTSSKSGRGLSEEEMAQKQLVNSAIKSIKSAYLTAKRAYRIPKKRLERLQEALDRYVGTKNFYNYTIQKTFRDPSAKRHIKSFNVNQEPIIINGTEWVSLKVHGQSFMMHQIRKMVAMAALVVRCGCDPERIVDTYGPTKIAIPKAPGLGLLLERPIFDSYNKRVTDFGKDPIDFSKYEKEINEFKQREIYERIFREEEEKNSFGAFFNHIDHFPEDNFLYVTSGGLAAAKPADQPKGDDSGDSKEQKRGKSARQALADVEGESEPEGNIGNGEEGG
ncbi:pseudouridine synthase [Paecilomyces variotii]|uniref:tRNA pseudouridine synthase 1 n=1 Tax=Byssochlamys spectabilis TaxID=264951 RepID=A0A443HXS0_BYSSP|nr:pseudouridine synthase [Paecilomyces variotii]RWQ96550.1 pseudouridine synthase [Paecilomyces variotii]